MENKAQVVSSLRTDHKGHCQTLKLAPRFGELVEILGNKNAPLNGSAVD